MPLTDQMAERLLLIGAPFSELPFYMSTMVIILAGNSEIGAHVHSESGSYYLERGGSGHLHSPMPPVRVPNSEKKYYKSKIIFNPDYGRFYRLITHIESYINLFPSIYILLPTLFSSFEFSIKSF